MNFKTNALLVSSILIIGTIANGSIVKADNDDEYDEYDDHEYREKYEKYREDDDDRYEYEEDDNEYEYDEEYDYEYDEYDKYTNSVLSEQDTWNIWTRTIMVQKGKLPFNDSKNVSLKVENKNTNQSIYIIPRDGEFFVPGKVIAESLGAEATVYKTSKILEITDDKRELIFRANTNVAYDNEVKTPLPSVTFYLNDDIYIPISVITNGLGYSVEWQEENNTFICRALTSN